jgi:hypothetical protein
MDAVENELKCHFRSCQTSTGDLILWNKAFLTNDAPSFDRGNKFLNGWAEFACKSDKAPFSNYWKQFKESDEIDAGSTPAGGSAVILV